MSKKHSAKKIFGIALILFAIIGLAVSANFYYKQAKTPEIKITKVSQNEPSSNKLSDNSINNYSVPPANPKYITIPSINLSNTPIYSLGINKDNQISAPDNIYKAGWYTGSAKPGQSGAMFVYGHVSSWTATGAFYNLKNLKPGNKIIITTGANKTYTYKVVSKQVYDQNKVDMKKVLAPIDPNRPGLNLMTCTGQIIKGTSEFNQRLVVYTTLAN